MRQAQTTCLKNNPISREIAKAGTRIETKTKGCEGSIVSFMEKTKGTQPRIAQMPRRPKKGSKAEQIRYLRHNNPQER